MGSGGTAWEADDLLSVARLNQKTIFVGATEPAVMYAGMLWYDTDNDIIKQRNASNNAWHVSLGSVTVLDIKRGVTDSEIVWYAATDIDDGPYILMYGGSHVTNKGIVEHVFGAYDIVDMSSSYVAWRFDQNSTRTSVMKLTSAGQLQLPIQGSSGGILLGGDVKIYRSDANELRIPDNVVIDYSLYMIADDRKIYFGSLSDVNLYWTAANILKTDDQLQAADGMVMFTKDGAISDDDFLVDTIGLIGIDITNDRIYFRTGAAEWHYVNATSGLELGHKKCFKCGKIFKLGEEITMIVDSFKSDGMPHALPCHKKCQSILSKFLR